MTSTNYLTVQENCKKHPRTKLVSNWRMYKPIGMKKALMHKWDCPKCTKINKLKDLVGRSG